jgi:type II secretory pathway pseudopilin PulG
VELLLLSALLIALSAIVLFALNPERQSAQARNAQRQNDTALLADALAQYTRDHGESLLLSLPLAPLPSIEICSDSFTGSCTNLLDLRPFLEKYLDAVPLDPSSRDPDRTNEHTRYFVHRTAVGRVMVLAPDTELDLPTISASR